MRSLLLAVVLVPLVPVKVVDGDTFDGRIALRPGLEETVRVRLDCYSAPELRADGGGLAETRRLAAWLAQDGGLWLRTSYRHEKYGRLLGEPVSASGGFCEGLISD